MINKYILIFFLRKEPWVLNTDKDINSGIIALKTNQA